MGQGYLLINLDKRQKLGFSLSNIGSPFWSGQKLREQLLNLGVKPLLAMALVQFEDNVKDVIPNNLWGSWSGDRVVLIGDYSDDRPAFLTKEEKSELETSQSSLYNWAINNFQEPADNHRQWIEGASKLEELFPPSVHHVIVNLDTMEYLDPEEFGDDVSVNYFSLVRNGVMKGLFSCLFYSTGRGGGDIEAFTIGRWAGDHLKIVIKESLSSEFVDISEEVYNSVLKYT